MKIQKGITLVALIVTIVGLLILAAVSISAIQDGGLVDKASGAVNQWNNAQNNEESILQEHINYLDNSTGCKHIDAHEFYVAHGRWMHKKYLRCPDCKKDILVGEEQCTTYQGEIIENWGYCDKCGQS